MFNVWGFPCLSGDSCLYLLLQASYAMLFFAFLLLGIERKATIYVYLFKGKLKQASLNTQQTQGRTVYTQYLTSPRFTEIVFTHTYRPPSKTQNNSYF